MNCLRRWSVLAVLSLTWGFLSSSCGQAPQAKEKKTDDKPAAKWLLDRSLTVTPATEPVPAFKYRLYPPSTERKEGNAVPIYLRFAHERIDAQKKQLREEPAKWNKLPLEKLPLDEVKQFLGGYKYKLRQLELGARRRTADWSYTLDAGDPIGLLLPDTQEMRMYAPLLILKARMEIAERRYQDALHTLETGFSFSQQISEAPFLISGLVGIAVASQFADCLLELMERSDAPNVYWALTLMPRSLVDFRKGYEFEQRILELQFPDLADVERPRSAKEWDAALLRFRKEYERIIKFDKNNKPPRKGTASTDPADKSPDLPIARKYLAEVVGISEERIKAMPPAQVLLLYLKKLDLELRDEMFKSTYVPFFQSRRLVRHAEARLKSAPDTEAARLAQLLFPAIPKVRLAQVRLDRKLDTLRVIEALRMHAAANGRQLPDKLDDVKIVPVPNDPGTGRPFEYHRDGQTATLISRIPGEKLESTGLRYRITLRK
ncbi:MAG TPA: hypothetical protein VMG10_00730 [Gemmataceae bacterium]|nr:hypothetical protein [Gemmataceae bacterium]